MHFEGDYVTDAAVHFPTYPQISNVCSKLSVNGSSLGP